MSIGISFSLFQDKSLHVAEPLVGGGDDPVPGLEPLQDLIDIGVLAADLDEPLGGEAAVRLEGVNPAAARLLVEAALGHEDGLSDIPQLEPDVKGLSPADTRRGGAGEIEVDLEPSLADLGEDPADLELVSLPPQVEPRLLAGLDTRDVELVDLGPNAEGV